MITVNSLEGRAENLKPVLHAIMGSGPCLCDDVDWALQALFQVDYSCEAWWAILDPMLKTLVDEGFLVLIGEVCQIYNLCWSN